MTSIDDRLEQTIGGKYRIVKFLAEGGMGSVYEAQHLVVKRRFAMKFLRSDLMRRRDVLARFRLEAEAAGAIESENIAAALDFGIAQDGTPYIVMEYLDGIDLARLLTAHGPLPPERAADLVQQACVGTQRAHDAGVLHRDLKPRNLFVCTRSDGTDLVKIVDFGVAKLQAREAMHAITRTGGLVGTPSYMSPEQARGEPDIDARTDVHALGVILYELLSGRPPHPGSSYNAVLHHIATQPALRLETPGRDLAPGLRAVVERAIAPRVQDRPASAGELGRELADFARRAVWAPVPSDLDPPASSGDLTPDFRAAPPPAIPSRPGSAIGSPRPLPEPSPRTEQRGTGKKRGRGWPARVLMVLVLGTAAFVAMSWSTSFVAAPEPPQRRVAALNSPPREHAVRSGDTAPSMSGAAGEFSGPVARVALGVRATETERPKSSPAHPERAAKPRAVAARANTQPASGARFDTQNPYD